MSDLVALMSQLVDHKGKIMVPDIYDTVAKMTPEEEKLYDAIEFDMVRSITSMRCFLDDLANSHLSLYCKRAVVSLSSPVCVPQFWLHH